MNQAVLPCEGVQNHVREQNRTEQNRTEQNRAEQKTVKQDGKGENLVASRSTCLLAPVTQDGSCSGGAVLPAAVLADLASVCQQSLFWEESD